MRWYNRRSHHLRRLGFVQVPDMPVPFLQVNQHTSAGCVAWDAVQCTCYAAASSCMRPVLHARAARTHATHTLCYMCYGMH